MPDLQGSERTFTGRAIDLGLWRRVFRYALAYRFQVVGLIAQALLVAAIDTGFPLVTRAVVDGIVAGDGGRALRAYLPLYAAMTIALAAAVGVFIRLAGFLATHVSHDIRRDGFRRMQALSFSFFDGHASGWLVSRLTSDCDRLAHIVAWGSLDVVWGSSVMIASAVVLLALDLKLGLVTLVVVPALLGVSLLYQRRILESARAVRKTSSRLTAAYSEAIQGVRTTKALGREAEGLAEFGQLSGEMLGASLRNALETAAFLPIVTAVGSIGTALALAAGGVDVASGRLSLGTLLAFLAYTALFFGPIQEVANAVAQAQMAGAAAERVLGLIATESDVKDAPEVEARLRARAVASADGLAPDGGSAAVGVIEFVDVSFGYGGGRPVLEKFSLRVEPGETIALVGPTGGGKTTIVSLLCRFYEPTAGEIRFGGVAARARSLGWLRSRLGVVLQTPHLFTGTVAENIRYGRLDASDGEVEEAARRASAHDFITRLEAGYGTNVGEGGGRLSSGQRALIAIARALLAEPEILVLDEATSSVDTETEARIQEGLLRAFTGRTSFVIAHRLSTVRAADRILFIDGGRIVEAGTHRVLLAAGGRYADLYAGQVARAVTARRPDWLGPVEGNEAVMDPGPHA